MEPTLFQLVFSNITISRLIFEYTRFYKKNEIVEFNTVIELREYKEREYINKIIYNGFEMLKRGDLPIEGVLKEVEFGTFSLSSIKGDSIPYGVEIITYFSSFFSQKKVATTLLSTLPPTIHTVNNCVIRINIINDGNNNIIIPPNITSISFQGCPNISGYNCTNGRNWFINLPNSIKSLEFNSNSNWNNEGYDIAPGDIPNSLIKLSMMDYIKPLYPGTLPNSIKELYINCKYINQFNFLPSSIENLSLFNCGYNIKFNSNLSMYNSLKKLLIHLDDNDTLIEPYSIPGSVTDLELRNIGFEIPKYLIPDSVKTLVLAPFKSIDNLISIESLPNTIQELIFDTDSQFDQPLSTLPLSLTSLELNNKYSNNNIIQMIPLLKSLNSLKYLILPSTAKYLKLDLSSNTNICHRLN